MFFFGFIFCKVFAPKPEGPPLNSPEGKDFKKKLGKGENVFNHLNPYLKMMTLDAAEGK